MVLLELGVNLVTWEKMERRATEVNRERLGHKEIQGHQGREEMMEVLVRMDFRVHRERLGIVVFRDQLDLLDKLGILDLRVM